MKLRWLFLAALLSLMAGCEERPSQGGSDADTNAPVTGRGSGQHGDTGGNGKVYDRGGAPTTGTNSTTKPPAARGL